MQNASFTTSTATSPNRYGQTPKAGKLARQKNRETINTLKVLRREFQMAMSKSPTGSYQHTQAKVQLCEVETDLKKYGIL